jgi:hypothetical protein
LSRKEKEERAEGRKEGRKEDPDTIQSVVSATPTFKTLC